jgi:cold shock CspA family protein
MPAGIVRWFDPSTGMGRIGHSGREYPVAAADIEPRARLPKARVHFDVERDAGVLRAVHVRAVAGTRSTPGHRRVGDLVGARHPEDKAGEPLTRRNGDRGLRLSGRPSEVVREWLQALARSSPDAALPLYAPDAVVHVDGLDVSGRNRLRDLLQSSDVTGGGFPMATISGRGDGTVEVTWPAVPGTPARRARLRVAHGQIAEQWGPDRRTRSGAHG